MKAKKWVVANKVVGQPKDSDLKIVEEELPPLEDNEFLCQAIYLTVDPYMRPFLWKAEVGAPMPGEQVARVIESRNADYPVGCHVLGGFGWSSHSVARPGDHAVGKPNVPLLTKMPDLGDLPLSLALGVVGMPGATAFFGFTKLLHAKPGDVVLVNAAAGAVGSVVGQIAKIKGCKVVGCAGTEAKCAWLKDLGFDHVINYKTTNVSAALKEAAPDGFDCYFDNVGGDFTSDVLSNHMKLFGRVAVCGAIADYNLDTNPAQGKYPWTDILFNQLTLSGFIVRRWADEWDTALNQLKEWVHQGKIKYREHVTEGFDNMRQAFFELFTGENKGKAVVKA